MHREGETRGGPAPLLQALGAAALGLGGWVALAALAGEREAWDSGLYFALWLPASALACAVFTRRGAPPWLAAGGLALGQLAGLFLLGGIGGLWPLGVAILALLHLPALAVGLLARRRRAG